MATIAETSLSAERRMPLTPAIAAAVLAACAALYFFADVPVAVWAAEHQEAMPTFLQSFFDGARVYGQVYFAFGGFFLILLMDPKHRKGAILFAIAIITATLAVDILKVTTGRMRPGVYMAAFARTNPSSSIILDHHLMWNLLGGLGHARFNSLPSAHSAAAFAMTGILVRLYPRGAWVFYSSAILCAVSRVLDLQHYPSDILLGSAMGLWVSFGVFRWKWSTLAAERITRKLFPASAQAPQ